MDPPAGLFLLPEGFEVVLECSLLSLQGCLKRSHLAALCHSLGCPNIRHGKIQAFCIAPDKDCSKCSRVHDMQSVLQLDCGCIPFHL